VRVLASVLAAAVVLVPSSAATQSGPRALLVRDGNRLAILYVGRAPHFLQPLTPRHGTLQFSGDGRLISIGASINGRTSMPGPLVWGPTGERAAAVTPRGGVVVWTPATGKRVVARSGWGAQSVAWSRDGALAIGRFVCPRTCAYGRDRSIWVWRNGKLARRLGPFPHGPIGMIPEPFAWTGNGAILWWWWPGSSSVAADGVAVYRNGTRLGTMLMYPEYAAVCGAHLALAEGGDRYSTHGKWIDFDGRDVSRDTKLSWVSPTCTADGRLVAAAGPNSYPRLTTETHRAIWQLLPTRKQLTSPPEGWSDEDPHLFADGSLLFVRSRTRTTQSARSWTDMQSGRVMLLVQGKLHEVAQIGFTQPGDVYTYPVEYYGRYDWSQLLAVTP
jgi:hypothetical protein